MLPGTLARMSSDRTGEILSSNGIFGFLGSADSDTLWIPPENECPQSLERVLRKRSVFLAVLLDKWNAENAAHPWFTH